MPPDSLHQLERRFDGPILPHDPAAHGQPDRRARARLFHRLAAEQRARVAARRIRLAAPMVVRDGALARACGCLRFYRDQGVGWV